ncbi:MAG: tyrosine-type recombinase/integrase, partial [Selenomonadaceae bacterium]|nr:tyrosine-type recombinase/integrase [Selenomonadaceae bacterium]
MGKRNSGEGGFFHDVNRGIWIYQLRYTDAEGNHKRKKFAAKTKREAIQKGKEFIDALNQKPSDDSKQLTLGNWIINWLENYAKPNVRPRTYEKYSSTLKAYILPTFENVLLDDLNAADLQKHFNRLLETGRADGTGLSTSTVRGTRRYLSMCIDEAVKLGLVSSNVVRLTKPPKLAKKEITILSKSEIDRLIEAAKEIDHPFMSVVMPEIISLTVHTGMRQGEVFGLKWEDVDFEKSCLFIRRSLAHVIGKGAVFQAPKTKNSIRRVLLMPEDVEN